MERYASSYLHKCSDCSFVFSTEVPSETDLVKHYESNYNITSYFSPITRKRYEELLEKFEPFRKTNRILDIGCGLGFFLEVAKEKSWEVYGLELSDKGYNECVKKGIPVAKTTIENTELDPESFDVIVSIEVIEHVISPLKLITQSNRFLRKGGATYVTTPNFNSYLRMQMKEQYDVINYPTHLCYFTSKTLRKAFESNGFNTRFIKATGMSVTRVKTSKGKSNQEYVSETSDDEMLRHRIESNAFLRGTKHLINSGLTSFKLGHSLKGFFIKE